VSERALQRSDQRPADGRDTRLRREPMEPSAVVRDGEPNANDRAFRRRPRFVEERRCEEPLYTNSIRAMGALSPWRGPSLRMRV